VTGNTIGIQIVGVVANQGASISSGNSVLQNTIDRNTYGVFINGGKANTITGADISLNSKIGLSILGGSAMGNVVKSNTFNQNGSAASGATAGSTVGDAIYIESASGNTIQNNLIQNSGLHGKSPNGVGVYIFSNASGNQVSRNTIKGSSAYGIFVYNSAANLSSIPRTGPAQNTISGSGIASFREFTGAVTSSATPTTTPRKKPSTGHSTPKGPKVAKQSLATHSHPRINHR